MLVGLIDFSLFCCLCFALLVRYFVDDLLAWIVYDLYCFLCLFSLTFGLWLLVGFDLIWFDLSFSLVCLLVCFGFVDLGVLFLICFDCVWTIVIVIWFWFDFIDCFRCCWFGCCFDCEHLCLWGVFGPLVTCLMCFDLSCFLLLCVWLFCFGCWFGCWLCIMGFPFWWFCLRVCYLVVGLPETCWVWYDGIFGFELFCLVVLYLICFT